MRNHDYDTMARLRSEAAGHYNSLGPGLQYHYSIDNVGEIFWVRDHNKTTWHAGNLDINRRSIAIKLDGYFHQPHNQRPTREQYEALQQLLTKLCSQHPEFPADFDDVWGHREISATACPGDTFFPWVRNYRLNNGNVPIPAEATYDWPEFQPQVGRPPTTPPPAPTPATTEIKYRVMADGKQVGAYTVDANAWNKYKSVAGSAIKDQNGNDVTAQLAAKFDPPKPPPAIPETQPEETKPIPVNADIEDLKQRVAELEGWRALIDALINKLKGVFK